MEEFEIKDIQGIIVRGYGYMPAACFVLLGIQDARLGRTWLGVVPDEISDGDSKPPKVAFNIAFTHAGLERLGLGSETLMGFSREFQEGMVTNHRSRILGDHGRSAPQSWDWGGSKKDITSSNGEVHILLMLYAINAEELQKLYLLNKGRLKDAGLIEIRKLDTVELAKRKEHFGFHDGIAQPAISGLKKRRGTSKNIIATGEIVLGYPNQYGKYPEVPMVPSAKDQKGLLPQSNDGGAGRDFGRNGSYLVFRQLRQDVHAFWQFIDKATKNPDGSSNIDARIKLASKMVGRWPGGAPLVLAPEGDREILEDKDSFGYSKSDPFGLKCPIGSHIRRTNPRDSMEPGPEGSLTVSNRHRILRRGRSYGNPIHELMMQDLIPDKPPSNEERGLYFICFNASISRQFEFVQQTWINNPKFEGLYDDPDPITGDQDPDDDGTTGAFTIQAEPVRRWVNSLPRFVEVRGGAYFFMPGIRALRYIASLAR